MQAKKLLIQTDSATLKVFEAVLGDEFLVVGKSDGLEALDWLDKGNRADLVIADAGMPYLSSLDFIKEVRLRNSHRDLPILILSELDRVTERNQYIQAGANDFVVKPLPKLPLKQRIRQLLEAAKATPGTIRLAS